MSEIAPNRAENSKNNKNKEIIIELPLPYLKNKKPAKPCISILRGFLD
jgi:hypothetical protein